MCGAVSKNAKSMATNAAAGCHSRSRNRLNRPNATAIAADVKATTPVQPPNA